MGDKLVSLALFGLHATDASAVGARVIEVLAILVVWREEHLQPCVLDNLR